MREPVFSSAIEKLTAEQKNDFAAKKKFCFFSMKAPIASCYIKQDNTKERFCL